VSAVAPRARAQSATGEEWRELGQLAEAPCAILSALHPRKLGPHGKGKEVNLQQAIQGRNPCLRAAIIAQGADWCIHHQPLVIFSVEEGFVVVALAAIRTMAWWPGG
jgi:hypothetical protein